MQTEREALAVVWGCERFRLFLLGKKFKLFTGHKALLRIHSRTSKPSVWIERWVLRLQQFDFEIKYKKGTGNPADALSRLSIQSEIEKLRSVTDEYVNFIIETRCQSIDIDEIRHETLMDDTLNLVIKALKDISWPKNSLSLHLFSKISQELCVQNNILLRNNKILLRKTLQEASITSAPKPLGN